MDRVILEKTELIEIIKSLIGVGTIKLANTQKSYSVGDVMVYLSGGKYYLYKCRINGNYSIPDDTNFKKLTL